jgi:hypothetical protein
MGLRSGPILVAVAMDCSERERKPKASVGVRRRGKRKRGR